MIPGGFTNAEPGAIMTRTFFGNPIESSKDKKGLIIQVASGQIAFIYATTPINTLGKPIILRLHYRADLPHASITLAALKESMHTTDGSLATHMMASSAQAIEDEWCLVLLFEPNGAEEITPIIQVVGTGDQSNTTILIDRLELTILEENLQYKGETFYAR